jgi:hypothetical protein
LVARIETEARSFQNAQGRIRDLRWGRVLGLLSAGVVLELWSRSASGRASDAIYHGMPARRLRAMLTPADGRSTLSRRGSRKDRAG